MTTTALITALGDEPLAPLVLARQVGAGRVVCVGRAVVGWRVPNLLEALRREGREATWLAVQATDVPAALTELKAEIRLPPDEQVVFDLTNAHGLVGFALYELARRYERANPSACRLVRVDWSDRRLRAISPDRAEDEPLEVRVRLGEFLELHGKRLIDVARSPGSESRFGRAAQRIARSVAAAQPALEAVHRGAWNRPLRLRPDRATARLIDELIDAGVLRPAGRSTIPADLRAYEFLHGRWLEEYLFETAHASGQFDDCASGIRFQWVESDRRDGREVAGLANEIDFAGTAGGRATVASCKTGFRELAGSLYELLTVAERAAGRSVVTVFATSATLGRLDQHRAAALGVRVLDAERLADQRKVLATLLGDGARVVR